MIAEVSGSPSYQPGRSPKLQTPTIRILLMCRCHRAWSGSFLRLVKKHELLSPFQAVLDGPFDMVLDVTSCGFSLPRGSCQRLVANNHQLTG